MKKLFVLFVAAATVLCGCSKLDNKISDLEKRVSTTEQTVSELVSKTEALQKLMEKINSNVSIKSVLAVPGGFSIVFSDNSSFTVVNGADGPQGPAGKDSKVTYTEEPLCYKFNFGDGKIISVSKAGAFGIVVAKDTVKIANGVPTTLSYEIVGVDKTTRVIVEPSIYNVEVGKDALTISQDKVVEGNFVFKAIRNSDCANSAVVITVLKKEFTPTVDIDLAVSNIKSNSATITTTVSDQTVNYVVSVESPEWTDQYPDDDDLFEADMAYYEYVYENQGKQYYDTFEEFFFDIFCVTGDMSGDWDGLDADTDYVAYVYALDEGFNRLSDIVRVPFHTEEASVPEESTYLGVGLWHESTLATWLGGQSFDLLVDVYEDNIMPGVYYFDSPYSAENLAPYFSLDPEDLAGYVRRAVISVDCSNVSRVVLPFQDMGFLVSETDGWYMLGSYYNGTSYSYGTLSDGVIAFTTPRGMLATTTLDSSLYYANINGDFHIILPSAMEGAPAKAPAKVSSKASSTVSARIPAEKIIRKGTGLKKISK